MEASFTFVYCDFLSPYISKVPFRARFFGVIWIKINDSRMRRMVLQKKWVAQNVRRISRISQSRFLRLCAVYVRLGVFFFLAKLSHGSSRLRRSQSTEFDFCFCKWCLNVLETNYFELVFRTLWTWSVDLAIEEVKMSRAHRKALVSASRSLAFAIHHRSRKSKEPMNPVWWEFHRLLWCTMNRGDLGSPQRNPPLIYRFR